MLLMGIADIYFHGVLCRYYRSVAMISFMIFIILKTLGTMVLILDFGTVCSEQTINLDNIVERCRNFKNNIKNSDLLKQFMVYIYNSKKSMKIIGYNKQSLLFLSFTGISIWCIDILSIYSQRYFRLNSYTF